MARASVMHSTSFPLPPLPPQETVSFHEREPWIRWYGQPGQTKPTYHSINEMVLQVSRSNQTIIYSVLVYHIIAYPYFGNIPILVGPKSGLVVWKENWAMSSFMTSPQHCKWGVDRQLGGLTSDIFRLSAPSTGTAGWDLVTICAYKHQSSTTDLEPGWLGDSGLNAMCHHVYGIPVSPPTCRKPILIGEIKWFSSVHLLQGGVKCNPCC